MVHQETPTKPEAPNGRSFGRRWKLAVILLSAGIATAGLVLSSVWAIGYTETPAFCGACHTMKPELAAYQRSPHAGVDCARCHIEPSVGGWVKAKLDGTVQLLQLVTNSFERPIQPAGHHMLQSPLAENCRECHRELHTSQDVLSVSHRFDQDEQNSEHDVAVVLKMAEQTANRNRGIHWHVQSLVQFLPRDEAMSQVDYVRVTSPSGAVEEYVSQPVLYLPPDRRSQLVDAARTSPQLVKMNCITCHNRIGHELKPPEEALDDALSQGRLDKQLPFIKQQGMQLLTAQYASTRDANAAIETLPAYYARRYPQVYAEKQPNIMAAVGELKALYPLVGSPEMGASFRDYPSYLGHRASAGCFRCHNGELSRLDPAARPIPSDAKAPVTVASSCDTCHTSPKVADPEVIQSLLGVPGKTHGAEMLTGHASVIRQEGGTATCAVCHSRPSCSGCHRDQDVLGAESAAPQPRARS